MDRTWGPLAGVLAVLAVVVLGGPATEAILTTPDQPRLQLASGVQIQPLPGWRAGPGEGVAADEAGGDGVMAGGRLLTRGSANLLVLPVHPDDWPGATPADLASWYEDEALTPRTREFLSTEPEPVTVGPGLRGVLVRYEGEFLADRANPVTGEVITVVAADGIGIVFDSWGTPGAFEYQQSDVRHMIDTVRVR